MKLFNPGKRFAHPIAVNSMLFCHKLVSLYIKTQMKMLIADELQ